MRRRWLGRPVGSSPHTRGTRYCTNNECETFRFIPAYAGNATTRLPVSRPRSVHPRIRGERQFVMTPVSTSIGSSPHTRGTRIRGANLDPHRRFIPACAGNAAVRAPRARRHPVHPRMRGERKLEFALISVITGSSPHARGTLRFRQPHACRQRFIPACAGNARGLGGGILVHTVHPRMRGERADLRDQPGELLRFIPACAGNAICGDHTSNHHNGSSPHARGTPNCSLPPPKTRRFIPACAGNARLL